MQGQKRETLTILRGILSFAKSIVGADTDLGKLEQAVWKSSKTFGEGLGRN
jgi:hypothetical protein